MEITTTLPQGYLIRQFEEKDLEKVVNINRLCLPENYTHSFFLDLFKSNPRMFIVAQFKIEVIGYAMARLEFGFSEIHRLKFARKGHLVSIAVMPEHRSKGIGSALLNAEFEAMEQSSCQETYLEVRTTNKTAIEMYKKLGYTVARRLRGYYIDGEDALLMIRTLKV